MAKGNLESKIATFALSAIATFAVNKLIRRVWKAVAKQDPPDPYDLEVTPGEAASWVAATAAGTAVAQVLVRRFVNNRYELVGKAEHRGKQTTL